MKRFNTSAQAVKNPNFHEEFGQYLKENGYLPGSQLTDVIYYFKKDHGIMITGDSVDFAVFPQGETSKGKPGCSRYAAFTGINQLDIFGWMMLLHITGAVPLKQLIRESDKDSISLIKNLATSEKSEPVRVTA
ncbi:MAG: hypothetical protein WCF67_03945 [Chitinophagaceae bacterium]